MTSHVCTQIDTVKVVSVDHVLHVTQNVATKQLKKGSLRLKQI